MATRKSARINRKCSGEATDEPASSKGVWQWEGDDGKWTMYDSKHAAELSKALTAGEDNVILQVAPSVKLNVRFTSMTQMNVATGWQRNVRCLSSKPEWEWENEHGEWKLYPAVLQRLLNACTECGVSEREIEAAGRRYKVDLIAKKQTNIETGVGRNIRQHGSTTGESGEPSIAAKANNPKTESSEEVPSKPTTSSGKSKSGAGRSKVKETAETEERVIVTAKGTVPVDYACTSKASTAHVYSEGGVYWDAMLNQTNLKNNNNKFYLLQLLQDNGSRAQYSVWFRWGRVGKTGQSKLETCGGDLELAKSTFSKKFSDKTHNTWEDRDNFVKVPGKYDMLKIDYEAKDETDNAEDSVDGEADDEDRKPHPSKLDARLQSLIELICNVKAMEDLVVEMKYDAQKAPLGKLTSEQIRSGYIALKKIEDCINRNDFGDKLCKACDEFYTRIPHCFGMQRPPLIKTREHFKEKLSLLEALGDIQIAMKILGGGSKSQENPIDRHYTDLKCELSPVDTEDSQFALIDKYMRQTHAKTHNQYKLELLDLFAVEREGEEDFFKDVGNRKLLWHGSRLTNWVGILSQGLRIAPPEAPVTGYMFGKGVYFADMSSKSANYCFASRGKNEGLVLLCDVSLGHTNELLAADYNAASLPRGKHSVTGLGRVAPNPAMDVKLPDGCVVPLGTSIETGVTNPHGYTLNYNEYIVYDTAQIRMKYLARVKFHFK